MRIAMVSEHASPLATLGGVDAGGQNVHVAALARSVAALGHEVVDAFYVVDRARAKVRDADRVQHIERAILTALTTRS